MEVKLSGVIIFIINSMLLGVGLAMDAFSVSMANAMRDPHMKRREMARIAGAFALFQFLMPEIGWICVHTIVNYFKSFQKLIPWIALILLAYIGGKMLLEGISDYRAMRNATNPESSCLKADENMNGVTTLSIHTLILQAIATSIDALSVGFAIAEYGAFEAFVAAAIIAVVTFFICIGGILIGRKAGSFLAWRASILGGTILIGIGLEIWISNILFS